MHLSSKYEWLLSLTGDELDVVLKCLEGHFMTDSEIDKALHMAKIIDRVVRKAAAQRQ